MVPKCHNHDFVKVALERRKTGEEASISEMEIVYKLDSCSLIMEYSVKISKKARILKLRQRHLKILTLTSYTPYPSRKIRLDGRWHGYKITINDHEERENEKEHGNEERCELFDNPHHKTPVCKIRRFEMIKYSFGQVEECVAIKECEYDDLTKTNEDSYRAYHENLPYMTRIGVIKSKGS
ncbi:hypothetical protein Tco_1045668 [Tanacetum coccineum]|uniref:Uncharacterized protein n=1 Tax=Tanacetum coccineum TaxID=301880 RepID=A0ABQ5GTG1_9ASTR